MSGSCSCCAKASLIQLSPAPVSMSAGTFCMRVVVGAAGAVGGVISSDSSDDAQDPLALMQRRKGR
jgi:hypothetical protein